MQQAAYTRAAEGRVHVFDVSAEPWQATAQPGLSLKPVRYDDERGLFLGFVRFEPMTRSGLHQHQAVATSFVVDGGLTDHHGSLGLHEAGINLAGATHDAIAYQHTLLVSRLEGPVLYPREAGPVSGVHAGSRHADELRPPAPEVPPEINVAVDALAPWETGIAGLRRQTVFDYAGTGSAHRYVQWQAAPGLQCPRWVAGAPVELWVRGGQLWINGQRVLAGSFVVVEAGAEVDLAAPHGALVLVWSEGPERWVGAMPEGPRRAVRTSLFGF